MGVANLIVGVGGIVVVLMILMVRVVIVVPSKHEERITVN